MKIFLRDTLTTAVFAGMLVCVISMIPYNTVEANNYSYKSHYMDTHAGDIRVLLLGNSLFEYSFNPHVVGDSVFDLATSARYIHYDVELAKRYLPRMEHLECVIYPLGLPEGYKERFKGPCMRDHYRYMHLDPPDEWKHLAASVEWDQRFHYKNFQRGRLCDSLGYQSMGTGVTGGRGVIVIDSLSASLNEAYLVEMAKCCANRGVRFVVVTPPCNTSLMVWKENEVKNILLQMMESVNRQYPAEYISYLDDDRFQADSLYYDAEHLNHRGATLFAQQVKEDLGL